MDFEPAQHAVVQEQLCPADIQRIVAELLEQGAVERLLDEKQAAETLNVAPSTLRKWRVAGVGPPFVKLEDCVRYSPSCLAEHVKRNTRRSTSEAARD